MPANIVKTKEDERHWEEAKERAKEEGQGDNYAYITSIFKSMSGRTAFTVPYAFAPVRVAGQLLRFQGLEIVLPRSASDRSASPGCRRGLLRQAGGAGGKPPVAAYVGPNALSPIVVLVREGGDRRALLVGFDDGEDALRAYRRQAGAAASFEYRVATIGEIAEWAGKPSRV